MDVYFGIKSSGSTETPAQGDEAAPCRTSWQDMNEIVGKA